MKMNKFPFRKLETSQVKIIKFDLKIEKSGVVLKVHWYTFKMQEMDKIFQK